MTEKQRELVQACIDLEKQIWETFSEAPRTPVCNDDWTDAYQEALEFQWFKDELNAAYIKAQEELIKYMDTNKVPHSRKVRTAQQYYNKQKDFEDTVAYYKKHHINGF